MPHGIMPDSARQEGSETTYGLINNTTPTKVSTDNISLYGLAANSNAALTLARVAAVQEKQTALNFVFVPNSITGAGDITVRYRVCARARSLIWQGNN
jgi:hypothetical protein